MRRHLPSVVVWDAPDGFSLSIGVRLWSQNLNFERTAQSSAARQRGCNETNRAVSIPVRLGFYRIAIVLSLLNSFDIYLHRENAVALCERPPRWCSDSMLRKGAVVHRRLMLVVAAVTFL